MKERSAPEKRLLPIRRLKTPKQSAPHRPEPHRQSNPEITEKQITQTEASKGLKPLLPLLQGREKKHQTHHTGKAEPETEKAGLRKSQAQNQRQRSHDDDMKTRIPTRDVISLRDLPDQPPVIEYRYDMDDDDGPGGGPGGAPGGDDSDDGGDGGDGEGEKTEQDGDKKQDDVRSRFETERTNPGSNNWAVSGRLTRDGRAILASDPHLQLQLPGSWYRIRMEWPDHDLVGLSIPGIPGIVMGSNGHVAWGFTNLTGDLQDIIALEIDPEDPNRYRTADGWKPFGVIKERIEILGEDPFELDLKTTQWGVVNATYRDKNGTERSGVREWAALNPELVNLNSLKVEDARNLEEALDVLASWNGPPQNAVVADSEGNVGFTVTGFLPDRGRKDGRAPYGLWDGTASWTTRDSIDRPRLSGEDVDYVFSANNRTVDQKQAKKPPGIQPANNAPIGAVSLNASGGTSGPDCQT